MSSRDASVRSPHRGTREVSLGYPGGIPGFLNIILSTPDGRRQLGIMINALNAPDRVYEVLLQTVQELGMRLLARQ